MPSTVPGDEGKARDKTQGADSEAVLLCFCLVGFLNMQTTIFSLKLLQPSQMALFLTF